MADSFPNSARTANAAAAPGIPGSGTPEHPRAAIPLPAHGFEFLDRTDGFVAVAASDVVSHAAGTLINAAGEKLGLTDGDEPDLDIDGARVLITAAAGLLASVRDELGPDADTLIDGVRTLQAAVRESAVHPDAPGEGPGEALLR